MATSLLRSWLTGIYNSLNSKIANYSNGASQMTVPTAAKISASDVNTIMSKLDALKSDAYFSTAKSTLFTTYTQVSSGSKINTTTKNQLDQIVTNFNKVVCKNSYTNSYGSYTNSYGTNSYGGNGDYSITQVVTNTERQSSGFNQHVSDSHGSYNYSDACSHTSKSHTTGTNSHGSTIDILNTNR